VRTLLRRNSLLTGKNTVTEGLSEDSVLSRNSDLAAFILGFFLAAMRLDPCSERLLSHWPPHMFSFMLGLPLLTSSIVRAFSLSYLSVVPNRKLIRPTICSFCWNNRPAATKTSTGMVARAERRCPSPSPAQCSKYAAPPVSSAPAPLGRWRRTGNCPRNRTSPWSKTDTFPIVKRMVQSYYVP
jgi:hypothetical protein